MSFLDFIIVPIITLLNVFIVAVILSKNYRSKLHSTLAAFISCLAAWIFLAFLSEIIANHEIKIFFSKLTYVSIELAVLFFLNFVYIFIGKKFKSVIKILITFFVGILVFITAFSNAFISDIKYTSNGFDILFGPYYKLFFIIVALFLFGLTQLIIQYFSVEIKNREQIRYFLFGFLLFAITNIFINVIVRQVIGSDEYYRIGNYSIVIFIFFTAYAIIKYRLMNIKFILTRSLVYVILVGLISSTFVFISTIVGRYFEQFGINQYFIWATFAFIIVIGLDPLKRGFAHITDRIFFKNQIDYNTELKNFSAQINEEVALYSLITDLREALIKRIKLQGADILIADETKKRYFTITRPNKISSVTTSQTSVAMSEDNPLLQYLYRNQTTLVTDEFDRYLNDQIKSNEQCKLHKVLASLEQLQAGVMVPIIRDAKITGLLVLGRKSSGDIFSSEDINLFEVVASQLASALQRSKLYEQIQTFNIELQKEVERATSDLRKVNKNLKEANAHLQELDVAKSEFMSIASHQLRTPLTGVAGYLSMILEGDYGKLTPDLEKVVKSIFDASQRLVRLVNTFLNVTRIEAGKLVLNITNINFIDLVKAEIAELQPTANHKGLKIESNITDETSVFIEADPDKISDVVLNLIDNAIKYTNEGALTINVGIENDSVHFQVHDTGIGIEPGKAGNLFQKFVRGSGIAKVQPNGSGLGLFIVKKIVEAHHGKVWVESPGLDKGSTFHVILPLKQPMQ